MSDSTIAPAEIALGTVKITNAHTLHIYLGLDMAITVIINEDKDECEHWSLDHFGASSQWNKAFGQYANKRRDLIKQNWSEVTLYLLEKGYSLIPTEYFNPNAKLPYHCMNVHYDSESETLDYVSTNAFDCRIVYSYPSQLKEQLKKSVPSGNVSVTHFGQKFLSAAHKASGEKGEKLGIVLTGQLLTVFAVNSGKLAYFNSFEVTSETDIVYYTLLMLKSLGKDPRQSKVDIWGTLPENHHDLVSALRKYIKSISVGADVAKTGLSRTLEDLPEHLSFGTLC